MKDRELETLADMAEDFARLLRGNAHQIIESHYAWKHGISASNGPSSSGGDISDPTASAALEPSRDDITRHNGRDLLGWYAALKADLADFSTLVRKLTPLDREKVDLTPSASCECCGGVVTQVGEDRIKAGFCPKDYRAWLRWIGEHPGEDRAAFKRQRTQPQEASA